MSFAENLDFFTKIQHFSSLRDLRQQVVAIYKSKVA